VNQLPHKRQPDAAALGLGGEKRREDFVEVLRRHTRSVVSHFDTQPPTAAQMRVHRQAPARLGTGRVKGVVRQIEQRLLQLPRIHPHAQGRWLHLEAGLTAVLPPHRPHQGLQACQNIRHRHQFGTRLWHRRQAAIAGHKVGQACGASAYR